MRKCFGFAVLASVLALMTAATASLPTSVQTALQTAELSPEMLGVWVSPVNNSQPLIAHLADTPRVPASTQKLITTAIALEVLGGEFVWQNNIHHTGVLAHGVVYGDVVLVGSGDPALTHERLTALMGALQEKVSHITGDIYIDTGRFENVGYDPNAFDGQGDRAYNAEPSAFLVNFGTVELKFTPSGQFLSNADGEPTFYPNPTATTASVALLPKLWNAEAQRDIGVQAGCALPKARFYLLETGRQIYTVGKFGADCGTQSLWRNFGDNDELAVRAVEQAWKTYDTAFSGQVKVGRPPPPISVPLVSLPSKPLAAQIKEINHFSNNVMTEQVALSLPVYAGGQSTSSYPRAFAFLNHWWQTHLTTPAPVMTRASGLCYDCQVSPKALASLLAYMATRPNFETFAASLPIAGQTGTMKSLSTRSPDNPAIGRAWIKTGTLNDATAMAGYVQGQSGQPYTMVAIINAKNAGYSPKSVAVLDEILAWTARQ